MVRHSCLIAAAAVALAAGFAAPERASAQIAWDAPLLVAPGTPRGLGIHLVEPAGGDLAVLGTWRASAAPAGYGVRLSVGEDGAGDVAVAGGVDISGGLLSERGDIDFDIIWVLGVGGSIGNSAVLSVPAGVVIGGEARGDGVLFRPYGGPRIVLDVGSDVGGVDDDFNLGFVVDLGVDVAFDPDWVIRFGASLVDREAISIGVTFPGVG